MEPHRERVKLGNERNWWRIVPVLGAIGLIGFMLVLTLMPNKLDEAKLDPSAVALLGSTTPTTQVQATIVAAPFPTSPIEPSPLRPQDPPPIQVIPAEPGVIRLEPAQLVGTATEVPAGEQAEPALLPTIVPMFAASATPNVPVATLAQSTLTPLPTSTARPTPGAQSHRYGLVYKNDQVQYSVARIEPAGVVPIASVDQYAERLIAILPDQQTLIIPRNQQLVAIDLKTGKQRWSYPLIPKVSFDYQSMLTLDQNGSAVHLIEQDQSNTSWRLSQLSLIDGAPISAAQTFTLPNVSNLVLTSNGDIWFTSAKQLYRFDPKTQTQQPFGAVDNGQILGDGRKPLIGVFRSRTQFGLIDWASAKERLVKLTPAFEGNIFTSMLSNDQTTLVVTSVVVSSNRETESKSFYSAYDLQSGSLISVMETDILSSLYSTANADEWFVLKPNVEYTQFALNRWNSATNALNQVIEPAVLANYGIEWLSEIAGAPINPLADEFQAAVTAMPTEVPFFDHTPLPTILPSEPTPVALFFESNAIQQIDTASQTKTLAERVVRIFPRYNQSPLILQRPQSKQWQLFDLTNQQTVQWEFEKIINTDEQSFMALLAPNYQSMLAVVGQDVRSNDQFTGASQLVLVNAQNGQWNVVADSRTWPELKWAKPIAWQGDTVYFLQTSKNPQLLWRVQLGPPFKAEKIAEIPTIVANYPDVDQAIFARMSISPNQRWFLYPLAAANNTMVLRVLDLGNQQSHDISLPLMELNELKFSPVGNSFAFMLPTSDRHEYSPALYQLEQKRWYQLDAGNYSDGENPFFWSPDGHWLAVNFSSIGSESKLNIYNAQQPSLGLSGQLDFDARQRPLALYNDGSTILTQHLWQSQLTQFTWRDQQWQPEWRLDDIILAPESIRYIYPR